MDQSDKDRPPKSDFMLSMDKPLLAFDAEHYFHDRAHARTLQLLKPRFEEEWADQLAVVPKKCIAAPGEV
jgi:hypothetical protein